MATERPKAGLVESTITSGTGAYQLQGAVSPWRGFVAADDAKVWPYGVYQDGGGFEEGEGTYSHSARTLTRNVLANHLGTAAPVDWGAGSKEVSVVIPASRVVLTTLENKYLADQALRAFRLYLDADDDTWLSAVTDDIVRFFVNSSEALKLESNRMTVSYSDDTAILGPMLKLDRVSTSPQASDVLAVLDFTGRDTAGNEILASRMFAYINSATPGSHSTGAAFQISKNGAPQQVLVLSPDCVVAPTGIDVFTGNKFVYHGGLAGCELRKTGEVVGVALHNAPGQFSRLGSDGSVVEVQRDGIYQGGLSVTAGVVTLVGATLSHPGEWAPGIDGHAFESIGWVVCTADGLVKDEAARHPLVRPSKTAGDPCVYGVVSGRRDGKLSIEATGSGLIRCVGPIARGDLLESSEVEGAAWRQSDRAIVSSTVAKATQSSDDDGSIRLVPCTLLAG
jgi:hypothetical protein